MRIALVSFVFGLSSLATAQSYVTSPSGFLTRTATGSSAYFGGDSFGRVMFFDGELGNSRMVIKEVAYRPMSSSFGRTWSNVSLRVSDCDVDRATTVFSANPTSTPTLVFSSAVTWPTNTRIGWTIRFPFRVPWAFAGTTDVCLDYDFSGGTLHNQTLPWWKLLPQMYLLDGFDVNTQVSGAAKNYGLYPGCNDTNGTGSSFWLYFDAYGPSFDLVALRNKHGFTAKVYTAPNAPGVIALGLAGNVGGLAFPGVSCEHVFLDLAKPVVLFPRIAGTTGVSIVWPSSTPFIPYSAALAGTVVWGQAGWNDTKNGALLFTEACTNTVPRLPTVYRRKVLFQPDNVKKHGTGAWPPAHFYPTLVRYAK